MSTAAPPQAAPAGQPPLLLHRPQGDGHPYHLGGEARVPDPVVAGEPVRLGVLAADSVTAVQVEICLMPESGRQEEPGPNVNRQEPGDGHTRDAHPRLIDLTRLPQSAAPVGAEGHLALAQESHHCGQGWTAHVVSPPRPWRYRFVGGLPDGTATLTPWFQVTPARWRDDAVGTLRCDRVVPGSVRWLVSDDGVHRVRFGLPLADGEHVIGLGERYDALDQRGGRLDIRVFEQYKGQGGTPYSYFPLPFAHVVGGCGWGFQVDTARRLRCDIGAADRHSLTLEADLDPADPSPSLCVDTWDGTPNDVLAGYLATLPPRPLLPEWVLGLWASGNEWNTQALVMDQVDRHEAEGIPVSVVVIEAWSDEEGFCLFRDARYRGDLSHPYEFDQVVFPSDGAWPDPAGMVEELHRRGIRVILWQIPLQKDEEGMGEPARAQRDALLASGHTVRLADTSPYRNRGWWFPGALMPDLTTPEGARWWCDWRRYLVRDIGIDGFKTDGGEHAWGHDLVFADGTRGEEGANLFPVAYARAYAELLQDEGRAPVTFSRSGFTGSQAVGAYWAGDEDSTWQAFRCSLRAGLSASACGVLYWGWDIAGFSGPVPDAEFYLRAWGASVFLPVMQYHSEFNGHALPCRDRTPWNIAEQHGRPDVLDAVRALSGVRERLRPYLAAQVAAARERSAPLMRALFFLGTQDPTIWEFETEYLLGDDLVVNPITEPGLAPWRTYVPRGAWVDPWTEQTHDGPAVIERTYGPREVPVLVRAEVWDDLRHVFASSEA